MGPAGTVGPSVTAAAPPLPVRRVAASPHRSQTMHGVQCVSCFPLLFSCRRQQPSHPHTRRSIRQPLRQRVARQCAAFVCSPAFDVALALAHEGGVFVQQSHSIMAHREDKSFTVQSRVSAQRDTRREAEEGTMLRRRSQSRSTRRVSLAHAYPLFPARFVRPHAPICARDRGAHPSTLLF